MSLPRTLGPSLLVVTLLAGAALALEATTPPTRRTFLVNVCPFVELSNFSIESEDGTDRFQQKMAWRNVGPKPLVAFEIAIVKYDPFDRRLLGSRWVVIGTNGEDRTPLKPGDASQDGLAGAGEGEVFTAIAYVRAARLSDGTIWRVNDRELAAHLAKLKSGIKEFGTLAPDPKP
jgi:hypothetical protein